ncbi:hypothetical protein MAR_029747, partial [Mya arenaria]
MVYDLTQILFLRQSLNLMMVAQTMIGRIRDSFFVSGTAGSAVRLLFKYNKSVQVVCPTGNSANVINGVTLHSFLKIPTKNAKKDMKAPEGSIGESLQNNLEGLKFYWLMKDLLLEQQHWAGWNLYVGMALKMLPPVLDSPIYNCSSSAPAALHGVIAWKEFDHVVNLSCVVRQNEAEAQLKSVLSSLRDYSVTPEQYKWLQYFQWQNLISVYGNNVLNDIANEGLFVFPTHKQVWEHNKNKLLQLNEVYPVAEIRATSKGRHLNSDVNSGLLPKVYLCKKAKVMLTVNLCVPFGLFNGATGIVQDILYLNDRRPPDSQPDVVFVYFPSYSGPACMSDNPQLAPIVSVERFMDCICHFCKRKQIPLRLGWATTIHKCQGITVGQGEINRYIVIDPGKTSFESRNSGALFVTLSRAKSTGNSKSDIPPDFAWHPSILINDDRICFKVNTKTIQAGTKEIQRLKKIADITRTRPTKSVDPYRFKGTRATK